MERRMFLAGSAALGIVTACGPKGPGSVTIVAKGSTGMNPGSDGIDRPVTLQVIQMRGTGAFDTADYFALQQPAKALGADFVMVDQIAVAPGGTIQKAITLDSSTAAIGVVAGFLQPAGKAFRAKSAVSATGTATLTIEVGKGGITLTPK